MSDESKFNLLFDNRKDYRRNRLISVITCDILLQVGKRNIMVWSCFLYLEVGLLYLVNKIINQFQYREILQNIMLPYAIKSLFDE